MRRLWIVLLLVVLGSLSVAQAPRGVPDARYGRLARGR